MKVSLTLDNGPDPIVTPKVLDTLRSEDVLATFFMLGQCLQNSEAMDVARLACGQGHRIGNHTFTHCLLGALENAQEGIDEIEATQHLIGDLANDDKLFRPTGGGGVLNENILSRSAFDYLLANRYSCVIWNSVPRDWEGPTEWIERALADIRAQDWTVLVLHDVLPDAMAHLGTFIGRARDMGAEFTQNFPEDCAPVWRGAVRWQPPMTAK